MSNEFVIKNGFVSNGDSVVNGSLTAQTLTLTNLSDSSNNKVLAIDENGLVSKKDLSYLTGTTSSLFMRNQTNSSSTDTIKVHESIFNPCDLEVLNTSIFIIDDFSCYYVLGDLNNDGSILVNGTLKIGGALTTTGPITGSGVIE